MYIRKYKLSFHTNVLKKLVYIGALNFRFEIKFSKVIKDIFLLLVFTFQGQINVNFKFYFKIFSIITELSILFQIKFSELYFQNIYRRFGRDKNKWRPEDIKELSNVLNKVLFFNKDKIYFVKVFASHIIILLQYQYLFFILIFMVKFL